MNWGDWEHSQGSNGHNGLGEGSLGIRSWLAAQSPWQKAHAAVCGRPVRHGQGEAGATWEAGMEKGTAEIIGKKNEPEVCSVIGWKTPVAHCTVQASLPY